jgi:hypothetical protein
MITSYHFGDFKEDTIALINNENMTDEEILDSLIYNCVIAKEKIKREEYGILEEIGNVGLTD